MLVVLREGHHVAFRRDLQPAAATHLHVRTFKFSDQMAVSLEHGHVKSIPMAVADQNITCIAYVDPVWVVGDVFATNAVKKLALFVENDDTVALKLSHTGCLVKIRQDV